MRTTVLLPPFLPHTAVSNMSSELGVDSFSYAAFAGPAKATVVDSKLVFPSLVGSWDHAGTINTFPATGVTSLPDTTTLSVLTATLIIPFFFTVSTASSSSVGRDASLPCSTEHFLLVPTFPVYMSIVVNAPLQVTSFTFSAAPSMGAELSTCSGSTLI